MVLRAAKPFRAALAWAVMVAMAAPLPAYADFFDGARKTFETDIPHFFQDDIPCAFGAQPTSHTKASCHAGQAAPPAARPAPPAPVRPRKVDDTGGRTGQ